MGVKLVVIVSLMLGISQNALAVTDPLSASVIYGDDNRKNLFEINDPLYLRIADASVALFSSSSVSYSARKDEATLFTVNYKLAYSLCSTERFVDENVGAFCSGFLVDDQTVITAGHCIESDKDCANTDFIFGFGIKEHYGSTPKKVPTSEVYKCTSIVNRRSSSTGPDYAVVRLDRPVTNHTPLKLNRTGYLASNAELAVVGHPGGLPTKISDHATVRDVGTGALFTTNTDTYGGNSGSAVFNVNTGEVEGILVQGETDYVRNGLCYVSKVCKPNECTGEKATKISFVLSYLKK